MAMLDRLSAGEKFVVEALRATRLSDISALHDGYHQAQVKEPVLFEHDLFSFVFCFAVFFVVFCFAVFCFAVFCFAVFCFAAFCFAFNASAILSSSKDSRLELGGNQVLRAAMFVLPNVKEYFTDEEMMSCDMKIGKRVEALLWYCMTSPDLDVK